ncbi:MAG: polyribonucleotide nucleotidyltransferase [Chloroflexi bacterium]|nr:MAG: polyribonucleotide nucleotidyltransferase [Chloroflexota bacterium]HDN80237.1 polyribonucleotide nucleotidyltransferase [Chloroflexota bacterium]
MSSTFEIQIGSERFIIETGKVAFQAGGAVTVRWGETVILATATASREPREGIDFFPLTVDFEERLYAAGKIPGSFFRREGRPSESAILLCRLVDRPIRPLFPKGMRNDVHIVITALSSDGEHSLDIPAMIGASTALTISDIPFNGPIGAVKVGYIDGEFVINPTNSQMEHSLIDIKVAGTEDAVLMVEAGAKEAPEDLIVEAIKVGHKALQDFIKIQREMAEQVGKPKREPVIHELPEETRQAVAAYLDGRLEEVLDKNPIKAERNEALDALLEELMAELGEEHSPEDIREAFTETLKALVRKRILEEGKRPDGRGFKEIRPISCEVGILPRTHGSGLFTRGETQVLTIATLGTHGEEQILDGLTPEESKRFIHHYNFPPYCTGEAKPIRAPSRREIGHGALAERALVPVIPPEEEFPYTIRLVSEVLSSNGSTSMASVCGSTLALMDAGVPIKAPVAGIAMGLVKEDNRYAILTDIQGMEDHLGDMDFKVAGTANGITALQMDIKIPGISYDIIAQALSQAREARLFILDKMLSVIDKPRSHLSPYAPRITVLKIDPEKIGLVIGPGGRTIRHIIDETKTQIDIEDDGTIYIAGTNGADTEKAAQLIKGLTEEAEIGKIYLGKVVRITDFGAFVEILPGKEGLVHKSQLADYRVSRVEDVVREGDEIMVMVIDIDKDGKIKLSRQAVLEGWTPEEARAHERQTKRKTPSRRPRRKSPTSIGARVRIRHRPR